MAREENSIKYYKKISACKQFKYYFKMIDMYALPITLRYKNQRAFYTNFGAMASLVIYLSLLSLFAAQFNLMFTRDGKI